MAVDAQIQLQAQVTKTASFQGAGLQLVAGTPRRGLYARVLYSAAANASGSNSVLFTVDVSRDGGVTYYTEFQSDPIALSTTAQSGELYIPFQASPSSVANGVYVRTSVAISGAGTSPTVTYQSDVTVARP